MPPQVVLIMTDTQPTDLVGCYHRGPGAFPFQTPSIDRIAAEGMRFDRAYCAQPVCGPARSALFTGIYPHGNGSWANSMPLHQEIKTLGQRVSDQGVHAAYIGKWHLDGGDYFGYGICPEGWDGAYWYDMRRYIDELTPEQRAASRQFQTCLQDGFPAEATYGHRCSNRAIDFLQHHSAEPFCLVVSYDEPHHPYLCPAPFNRRYENYRQPLQPNAQVDPGAPRHIRRWAEGHADELIESERAGGYRAQGWFGCNDFVDSEIGRVMEAIDRLAPGALVIYTSDHAHAMLSHGITSKGPAMYEQVAHIPLVMRWPGHIAAGSACERPVSHIDLMPTILEALNILPPPILDGQTLAPLLSEPSAEPDRAAFIEFSRFETDHDGMLGFMPIRCVVDARYKLVLNLLDRDELYDLQNDPYEMSNLIDSPEHVVARDALHERLLDWMNKTRDPFRGYVWDQRPWRLIPIDKGGMTRQPLDDGYLPGRLDYDTGLPLREAVRPKFSR